MPDIQSIIAQMTLEEKAGLCPGANGWETTPVERLGVPELVVADGPHGIRRVPAEKILESLLARVHEKSGTTNPGRPARAV